MQNLDHVLATLEFCRAALAPVASPVHHQRLDTIAQLLQAHFSTGQAPTTEGMLLSDYLYTLSLFQPFVRDHPEHQANLAAIEQFMTCLLGE